MRRQKLGVTEWHVTVRGAKRLFLCREDEDFKTFYGMMGDAAKKTGVALVSHCLMSNHAHLNPRADSEQLSEYMFRSGKGFADFHNRKYRMTGHAFEQSYWAQPIASPFLLTRVTRYIHLNPIRAGLATRPEDYRWSSCRQYFTGQPGPFACDPETVLQQFESKGRPRRDAYRAFVEQDLQRRPAPSSHPASELWQEQFRWLLEFAQEREAFLDPITPAESAIYWAQQLGIPPRAVAKSLGFSSGREVYNEQRRLGRRLAERPDLRIRLASLGIVA